MFIAHVEVERVYAYTQNRAKRSLVAAGVGSVPARFTSPSQDYSDTQIDLTRLLIRGELSTFIVRVSGDSMEGVGIYDGDELIVDHSIEPREGHVVTAIVKGGMTLKRLRVTDTGAVLQAENAAYPDVQVAELSELMIWGCRDPMFPSPLTSPADYIALVDVNFHLPEICCWKIYC